jgi:hypothetical protein
VTPVSHTSILTELNPFTHGLRVLHGVQENCVRGFVATLPEVLQEAGYQTSAFISAFPAGERFGLDQGFEVFDEDFLRNRAEEIVSNQGIVNTGMNQRCPARYVSNSGVFTTARLCTWTNRSGDLSASSSKEARARRRS